MMTEQKYKQQRFMTVTMEELVPKDHFLRQLDAAVDMEFIYELVRPLYSGCGRPSIDPVTLVKMLLIGYLYGVDSERKLEKEIQVNIAYRWYLGLDLEDNVPDHSTLSQNRRRRFKGKTVFEEIFLRVVRLCMEAGLVTGESIAMDSTHVRANADDNKREVVAVANEPREYLQKLEAEVREKETVMYGEKKKRGRKPRGNAAIQTHNETKSLTDPDSGILGRPGKPGGFHYLCHQSADIGHGVITDIHVTAGNRSDHECCVERIKAQKERLKLPISDFVADKGYDVVEVHHLLGEMGISVYTPESLPHEGWRRNAFTSERFVYAGEQDVYYCPGGKTLHFSNYSREKDCMFAVYRSRAKECRECPFRPDCFADTMTVRKIRRSYGAEYMEKDYELIGTERYYYLQRRRRIVCEGNFANMKDNGNLRRTRKRGLDNVSEHCLLCAVALNLKKLLKYG
jgi:transposase